MSQVLDFSRTVSENLSNFDRHGAWAVLLDEFVDYMQAERGERHWLPLPHSALLLGNSGGGGSCMDSIAPSTVPPVAGRWVWWKLYYAGTWIPDL